MCEPARNAGDAGDADAAAVMPSAIGYVLAVVPILGGASLFLGGAVAIALDRARLVRTERQRAQKLGRQPHLVLIRYLSAVIGDPKGWPHRVFLVCVTVYALCLIATGCLQAHILETRVPGSATWQLIVYPIAGGVCGVVMANFTNGHAACTKNSRKAIIFHCVFASGFIGFSVSYGGSTVSLATALAESAALQAARTACAITCGVGCFWNIMLAGAAAYGSIKLGQHEAAEDEAIEAAAAGGAATSGDSWNRTVASTGLELIRANPESEAPSPLLTPAQIRKIRCAEMMLAAGQCTAGTAVAALTAMGAAEMLLW